MSYSLPEENTLGAPIGRRGRRSSGTRHLGPAHESHRSSLGTSYLSAGIITIVALRGAYGIGWSLGFADDYPEPLLALAAWLALLAAALYATVALRGPVEYLSGWRFAVVLTGLGLSAALDVLAVWELHDLGFFTTAAPTAGMALLLVVTLRPAGQVAAAALTLGAALAAAMYVNTGLDPRTLGQQITTLAFAVLPALIALVPVRAFRRMMQVELDRVLVQSTVSAPRLAIGMLASEQLARLDLDAEKLLASVADGTAPLPLDARTSSKAASLATELRLHLIEGRRETWLYHAISESDLLGKSVTLRDPGSLAGLLDPRQRDGLLSAVWLLVADTGKLGAARTVQLALGPAGGPDEGGPAMTVPIEILTTGIPRNRVDPSVWDALGKVGIYTDSTWNASLRLDVRCLVTGAMDSRVPGTGSAGGAAAPAPSPVAESPIPDPEPEPAIAER